MLIKIKTKWLAYIIKKYRKYYPDPIDYLIALLEVNNKKFKSRAEAFTYMRDNSIGGLKVLFNKIENLIEQKKRR